MTRQPQRASEASPPPDASLPRLGRHIPALDGIRGIAILLVMIYHGVILSVETSAEDYFLRIARAGWCGVDLFFVLSGFLITGILHDAKGGQHYFRSFYMRRLVRIFPLYYAVLVLAFYVIPNLFYVNQAIKGDQAWFWLYASNFWYAFRSDHRSVPLDVTWSLAIEEQFYMVWPALMFFLSRRSMMKVCLAMIPLALLSRVALVGAGYGKEFAYFLTFCRLDALAVGAFIALAARGPGGVAGLITPARRLLIGSGLILVVIFLIQRNFSEFGKPVLTVGFTTLAVFFGSILVMVIATPSGSRLHRFLCFPLLIVFGKFSYAMYLFHVPVQRNISEHVFGRGQLKMITGVQLVGQMVFYLITISIVVGIAWLSWHLYEKHFLKLKKYFPY